MLISLFCGDFVFGPCFVVQCLVSFLASQCLYVYSFVIEYHLVEWLIQLKVYTSLNIV